MAKIYISYLFKVYLILFANKFLKTEAFIIILTFSIKMLIHSNMEILTDTKNK